MGHRAARCPQEGGTAISGGISHGPGEGGGQEGPCALLGPQTTGVLSPLGTVIFYSSHGGF